MCYGFTANDSSEAVAEPVAADQAATAAASTGDPTATGMETDATPAPSQDTPTGTAMALHSQSVSRAHLVFSHCKSRNRKPGVRAPDSGNTRLTPWPPLILPDGGVSFGSHVLQSHDSLQPSRMARIGG